MSKLLISNKIPYFLHCSMYGSYYMQIESSNCIKNKDSFTVTYKDPISSEITTETIPFSEVTREEVYYKQDSKASVLKFAKELKEGGISASKAARIILGNGTLELPPLKPRI